MKKKNIFKKLRGIIRLPYYFVPACPVCGSERTGRYVKFRSEFDDRNASKTTLKNGELIAFTNKVDTEANFFCLDCGCEWSEYSPVKLLSLEEIDKEKKKRCTNEMLDALIESEQEEKAKKKKGIFSSIRGFIGHL